jgi:uncharacterized membrane protein (UPF0127 family)
MEITAIVIAIFITVVFLQTFGLKPKYKKMKINNTILKVEVADTLFRQARGLMLRDSLPKNQGMLFIMGWESRTIIWTMGMRFPIDIIWLDKNLRVVDIVQNASHKTPWRLYKPRKKAKYVLEVNSGFVKYNKIGIGSKCEFWL